jgi:hypothetical protein
MEPTVCIRRNGSPNVDSTRDFYKFSAAGTS